ncbi:hypothetical protein [Martelella mediterranea]|uniref:Uncharacterized protein n=1 Tax=Martelella mediterranea TaxID=293089 RepID=A0A4R3NX76_9HYPH|nr:hypothetical protein [Martelella mediterranea]TCT43061.1 hypothetical protein EDC90_100368 [Martelella mediterranea]
MFRFMLPLSMGLALVACQTGPLNVLYKEGSTRSQRQEAYDQCVIKALKEVPQNMVTEVSGGYSMPGYVDCDTDGNQTYCTEVGGYTTPITSQSYDTNRNLRSRVINRCLEDKGYAAIQRPVCDSKTERASYAMLTRQPNAADITCVDGQSFDPS